MQISRNTRDALYWMSVLTLFIALFLAMAGVAKLPPALSKLAYYEIRPTKFVQQTTSLRMPGTSTRMSGTSVRYALVGFNEQHQERYFGFPDQPDVRTRLARITIDPDIPTLVKLWVEPNDFAEVLQLQQGDRMVWCYDDMTAERKHAAGERFIQAVVVLLSAVAFFFLARTAQLND